MKPISDRLLERARLGELPEKDYLELVARLEEADELYRLDDLIAEDEAFLAHYPAPVMANQIREKLRRAERQSQQDTGYSVHPILAKSSRPPAFWFAAGLGGAAILGLLIISTTMLDPAEVSPNTESLDGPAAPAKPNLDGIRVVDIRETKEIYDKHQTIVCKPGESPTVNTEKLSTMDIDHSNVARAVLTNSGKTLMIDCLAAGEATIEIPRESDEPGYKPHAYTESIHVIVGESMPEADLASLTQAAVEIHGCHSPWMDSWFRKMKVRFVVYPDGSIRHIDTTGSSAPDKMTACIVRAMELWSPLPIETEGIRVVDLNYSLTEAPVNRDLSVSKDPADRATAALYRGNTKMAILECQNVETTKCRRVLGVAYKKEGDLKSSCEYFKLTGMTPSHCKEKP